MTRREKLADALLLATVLFIWGHSLMPGSVSGEESSRVLRLLQPFLELFLGKGKVTEHLVRKLAHFSEYAVLGAVLGFREHTVKGKKTGFAELCAKALFVCFLDETIQLFVPDRAGMVQDMWIDLSGAAFGMLMFLALRRIVLWRKHGD